MAIQGFFTGDVKIKDLNGVLKAVDGIVEVATDAGTVTSVGLQVGTSGTDVNVANSPVTTSGNITLNLPTASATNRGLLSSADWAIFDAKQGSITLTTTGNNGSATLTSGTLNIPTYTLAGLGGISLTSLSASSPLAYNNTTGAFSIQVANGSQNGYLSSSDWTTFNSKQSALTFSSPLVNSSGTVSIPAATSSVNGYLTSTDWATFNNKQGAITLTTTGSSGAATLIGTTLNIPNYSGALTGYVPYTGATGNVDLGEYGISSGYFQADLTPSGTLQVGRMQWNSTDGTMDLRLMGNNVTLQIGQEQVARVVNGTGGNLLEANYQAVKIIGAQGQRLQVGLARADNDANSKDTLGLVTENINNNQEGFITVSGLVNEINTTGSLQGETWADGDTLYLSGTTSGAITNVKPTAPIHTVIVGFVVYAHANHGKIFVKVDNGYELEELHDVAPTPYVNKGVLYRDTATNLWKSATIGTLLGYTPANAATTLTINGTAYDLSANRTWNVGTVTSIGTSGPLTGGTITGSGTIGITQSSAASDGYLSNTDWTTFNNKQTALNGTGFVKISGTTISYDNSTYYLASNPSAFIALTALSATAPLSYDNTTGVFSISQATTSTNGYLSSTDWNTFYNKQAAGSYITALTGEATASGPGSASVTLSTSAVTGKLLTGLNLTGGGSIAATDSILQAFGKVQNQISGLAGGVTYQGVWNASTNTPTLTSSVGTKGYYYIVDVAGSTNLNGITDWKVGDWAIFNGSTWDKVDNTDAVSSVNGFTGAVSLTTSNISEGTNLYYLDSRARLALSFTAGSGAYDNTTGVITIPTNTSQLTNGANFITLSSLSASSPLSYNSGTGALSIQVANGSQNGYLSSSDWTTFNNKQSALTNPVTGTGTTNYLPKFTSSSAIGNSIISQSGSTISIAGSSTTSINVRGATGNGSSIYFTESGIDDRYLIGTPASSGDLVFRSGAYDFSTGSERMRLTSGGSLGIGTSAPSATLVVSSAGTAGIEFQPLQTTNTNRILNYNRATGTYVDLRIDANTQQFLTSGSERMRLDASGNLGLGVTPSAWNTVTAFQVGSTFIGGYSNTGYVGANTFYQSGWKYINSSYAARYDINGSDAGEHRWYTAPSGTAGNAISFTQAMTLDASGRLGIGVTSPTARLDVVSTSTSTAGLVVRGGSSIGSASSSSGQIFVGQTTTYRLSLAYDDNTGYAYIDNLYDNANSNIYFRVRTNGTPINALTLFGTGAATFSSSVTTGGTVTIGGASRLSSVTGNGLNFAIDGSDKMFLSTSGNLGLGVTPSAWGSFSAIQLGATPFSAIASSSSYMLVSANAYYDGSNFRYISTNYASRYYQYESQHIWSTAPSGTAGTSISWTQAMTLNASGNLSIGNTNDTYKLDVSGTGRFSSSALVLTNTNSNAAINIGDGTKSSYFGYAYSAADYMNNSQAGDAIIRAYNGITLQGADGAGGYFRLASTGAATFSSSVTAQTNLGLINSNASQAGVQLQYTGATALNVSVSTYNDKFNIYNETNGYSILNFTPSTKAFVINPTGGNVGIGTTSPVAALDVSGNATLVANFNYASSGTYVRWQNNGTSFGDVGSAGQLVSGGSTNDFAIHARSTYNMVFATNFTERMRITSGGNVGIGTTSPDSYNNGYGNKLVLSNTSGSTGLTIVTSTSANGNIYFADGTTGDEQYRGIIAYEHANDAMRFSTSATERMRITSGGNVLIGTAVSSSGIAVTDLLTIGKSGSSSNALKFTDGSSSNWGFIYASASKIVNASSSDIAFETGASFTERMRITSGGNVGIGTTSPGTQLQIDASSAPTIRLNATNVSGGAGSVQFYNQSVQKWNLTTIGTSNDFALYNNGGTSSYNLYISHSTGNVGIGTTSPIVLFTIGKIGTANQLGFYDGATAKGFIGISAGTSDIIATDALNDMVIRPSSAGNLLFAIGSTERMRITSGGLVGIGTSSPIDKLHIVGGLTSTSIAVPSNTSVGSLQIGYDGTNGIIRTWNSSPLITSTYNYQAFETSGSERLRITSGGNVGIGVTNPTEKLEVNGSIKTSAPFLGTAKPWKLGAVYTGTCVPTSWGEFASWATGIVIEVEIDGSTYRIPVVVDNYC